MVVLSEEVSDMVALIVYRSVEDRLDKKTGVVDTLPRRSRIAVSMMPENLIVTK